MKTLAIVALLCVALQAQAQDSRSVRVPERTGAHDRAFDASQSAALFVGIRRFTVDEKLTEVRYAVDDAIDLAFILALDDRVRLVKPGRVVLALSGEPQKRESEQHLNALKSAGAIVNEAGQSNILALLERQTQSVGKDGIFIFAIATHGFTDTEGVRFLVAANSLLRHRETCLSEHKIRDIAARSDSSRSIVFIDACRERLTSDTRSGSSDRISAAPTIRPIAGAMGQAVLAAAAAGRFAYDDDSKRNGVFTSAVIDGLQCAAPSDSRGWITIDTLAQYVDARVGDWVRKHADPGAAEGIQIVYDGGMETMPLSACGGKKRIDAARLSVAGLSRDPKPANVVVAGTGFNVFNAEGIRLWSGAANGDISKTDVADLDGDGMNEVVIGVTSGADSGKVIVFNSDGKQRWVADTTLKYNYDGGHGGRMAIVDLITADLFRNGHREIITAAIDSQDWYQSNLMLFDAGGAKLGVYWHPGHIYKIVAGARTPADPVRIIAAGVTNDLHVEGVSDALLPCVFMLDPTDVHGEAPPYTGHSGKGSHLWYGIIIPGSQKVERLEIFDRDQTGLNQISVWTSTAHVFYLSFNGQVLSRATGMGASGTADFLLVR